MFTTGNHLYLYCAAGLYGAAAVLAIPRRRVLALAALLLALIVHGLYLVGRGWLAGVFYANPIFEGPFFLPWCVGAVAFAALVRRRDLPMLPLLGLATVFVALALVYVKGVVPPTPKKMTALAALFFLTENLGHGLFYCGAVLAARSAMRRGDTNGYHSLLVWGFVVYSVSQVVGAAWCYVGWGNTFRWSPRHFGSAAVWMLFAAYLHLRFTSGWSARGKALFAVGAALATFVATYGNYLKEMAFPRVGG